MDLTMSGSGARDTSLPSSGSGSATLPPLDMLERFPRRGSITDPSLHTSTPPPGLQQRRLDSDVSPRHKLGPSPHVAVRPTSPYTFGSASATVGQEHSSNHLRRVLHSPEPSGPRLNSMSSHPLSGSQDDSPVQGDDRTPRDVEMRDGRGDSHLSSMRGPLDGPQFDYSMRRHSIATVQPSDPARMPSPSDRIRREPHRPQFGPGSGSLKRKMSHDRLIYSTVGEESADGSAMAVDPQEPPSKRRGSAFDTTRIAQLSLYDRRDSNDSRSPVSTQAPWDRRDSSSSVFSLASSTGTSYSSGFSAESHMKSMQSFSWNAANAGGSSADAQSNEAADSSRTPDPRGSSTPSDLPPPPPGDQRPMPSLPSMHPYATDRRMSAPDATPRVMDRTLRSRSRPPSTRGVEAAASPTRSIPDLPAIRAPQSHSEVSPAASETPSATLDSSNNIPGSSMLSPSNQLSNTPYSRSPELRVSHKMAERKRRKEMKELFDELRDQLPADRGMKASKWEILSKAVDYIQVLKQSEVAMHREVEAMRHELETLRATGQYGGGIPGPGVGHAVVYTQGPPIAPYPPGSQVAGRGSAVMHNYGAGTAQAQAAKGTPPM